MPLCSTCSNILLHSHVNLFNLPSPFLSAFDFFFAFFPPFFSLRFSVRLRRNKPSTLSVTARQYISVDRYCYPLLCSTVVFFFFGANLISFSKARQSFLRNVFPCSVCFPRVFRDCPGYLYGRNACGHDGFWLCHFVVPIPVILFILVLECTPCRHFVLTQCLLWLFVSVLLNVSLL
ncbi:hypothetical protein EDB83DRAFT_560724 [Lactarius deliciosus]|nr:hypothetical protein EDB83DRAFT_560724 [Lactarius deliciosus]